MEPGGPTPDSRLSDRAYAWIGLLLGVVAGAIPAFIFPHSTTLFSFADSPLPWWIVLIGLVGAIVAFIRPGGVWRWGLYVGLGLPVFVILRVFYDWFGDPASHSRFPFEVAAALLIGLPSALLGAYVGLLVKQLILAGNQGRR
ncbi:MAG: hypothetical protein PVH24_03670 [Candidatus Zixiibacteriota bacterium]|jgi:hypothetical protein